MREKEIKTFLHAIEPVLTGKDLTIVFEKVFQGITDIVPCSAASILLKDEKTGDFKINSSLNLSPDYVKVVKLREEEEVLSTVKKTKKPLIIDDVIKYFGKIDPDSIPWIKKQNIISVIIIPITQKNKLVGTLHIYFSKRHKTTKGEIQTLKMFSHYAAIAIQNAQLLLEREQIIERMKVINEVGRELVSSITLKKLLGMIKKEVLRITGAPEMFIALYNKKKGTIQFVLDTDIKASGASERKLSSGLTEWVIRNKKPLILYTNDEKERKKYGIKSFGQKAKSWLGVPIIYKNTVNGVMAIQDFTTERKFNEFHKQLLMDIANEAAIAIENAQLYGRLEILATTDSLTGLFNRRQFYKTISHFIRKNVTQERKFSLALIDLDNFKFCNDRFGHMEGDKILKRVGRMLKRISEKEKFLSFRYGGDEFAIIFPAIGKEEAKKILKKFFARFKEGERNCMLSLSGGIVEYPADGWEIDELMHKSDLFLYKAKNKGGDTIEI